MAGAQTVGLFLSFHNLYLGNLLKLMLFLHLDYIKCGSIHTKTSVIGDFKSVASDAQTLK